jgi:hypothetical protein
LRDVKCPGASDMDLDIVTLFQTENFDNGRGQPDGEAVTPFANLHGVTPDRLFKYI